MAKKYKMYIDGEWTEGTSGNTFEVRNPATGELIGTVPVASEEDVDRAFRAAKRVQRDYALSPLKDRMDLCYRM